MCGIAGRVQFRGKVAPTVGERMADQLSHRGPDGSGSYWDDQVYLGHRRLAIIDPEGGGQPMHGPDAETTIVFNGAIYNFRELRDKLAAAGYPFTTRSDTEVVLAAYFLYGIERTLEMLVGMFAFALYDKQHKKLFLVRDRFGQKPLYFHYDETALAFASELKGLESGLTYPKIDPVGLNLFLSLSYIPAPYTIYQGVQKCKPGHYLEIDLGGTVNEHCYYNLAERIERAPKLTDRPVAENSLSSALRRAVELQLVSDRPLGAFLSGGVDSSIVSAILTEYSAEPVQTFTLGFTHPDFDESDRARLVADHLSAQHRMERVDPTQLTANVAQILAYFDEPFADSSALATARVAALASEQIKVVLTGDGADELFAGYDKYLAPGYGKWLRKFPAALWKTLLAMLSWLPRSLQEKTVMRQIIRMLEQAPYQGVDLHYRLMCMGLSEEERTAVLREEHQRDFQPLVAERYNQLTTATELDRGLFTDLGIVLEGDMLAKVDRMTMRYGLEARLPFLDHRVVELAFQLPSQFKLDKGKKKVLLRHIFGEQLPKRTMQFSKRGFRVPIHELLRGKLRPQLEHFFSADYLEEQGLFEPEQVQALYADFRRKGGRRALGIWALFVFQSWYDARRGRLGQVQSGD